MPYTITNALAFGTNRLWFHGSPDSIEFVAAVGSTCTFAYAGADMLVLQVDVGKTSEVFLDATDWRAGWYTITTNATGTLNWTYKE